MADEKNRRLLQNGDIIYPFTKQENVIGLQKTITDKLPIISETEPQEGFVTKQVWIDIKDDGEAQEIDDISLESQEEQQQAIDEIENNYEIPIEPTNYGDAEDEVEENYEGEN